MSEETLNVADGDASTAVAFFCVKEDAEIFAQVKNFARYFGNR